LRLNEYRILDGTDSISYKSAEQKAFAEYNEFNKYQKIESDFDKAIKRLISKNGGDK